MTCFLRLGLFIVIPLAHVSFPLFTGKVFEGANQGEREDG